MGRRLGGTCISTRHVALVRLNQRESPSCDVMTTKTCRGSATVRSRSLTRLADKLIVVWSSGSISQISQLCAHISYRLLIFARKSGVASSWRAVGDCVKCWTLSRLVLFIEAARGPTIRNYLRKLALITYRSPFWLLKFRICCLIFFQFGVSLMITWLINFVYTTFIGARNVTISDLFFMIICWIIYVWEFGYL